MVGMTNVLAPFNLNKIIDNKKATLIAKNNSSFD